MREMTYDQTLNVDASAAWNVLADFGAFLDWNPMDVPYTVTGEGIGMVRTLDIPGLGPLGERLDARDADAMRIAYSLSEGEPLGMQTYAADVSLEDHGDGTCTMHWVGRFTGAEGADLDEMANNVRGSYQNMSNALERYVKANG